MFALRRRLASLALAAALVALSALAPARARPAAAAGGGTFTVNSANDSDTHGSTDSELSLREAIQIANGTLLGPFSVAEKTQMQGCSFSAGGNITNSCGGGNNLIQFTPTLTQVRLTAGLPPITANSVTVDGAVNSGKIVINGQALADDAFDVSASQFTLQNAAVINLNFYAVFINAAIKGLVLANNNLGVPPGAASCSDARLVQRNSVQVFLVTGAGTGAAGDGTAYLYGNVIGCSAHEAIVLSNIAYIYIGQAKNGALSRNWIGTDPSGHDLDNVEWGVLVCCSASAHDTLLIGNRIAHNGWDGIDLSGATANTVSGNELTANGGAGVLVDNSSLATLTNNDIHDNLGSGIWLTGTQAVTTTISGGAIHGNGAAGISEGAGAANNAWHTLSVYDNFGLGLDKNDNGLPDATGNLVITSTIAANPGITVTGTITGFFFSGIYNYQVELYALARDPSGYGEGRRYIGTTLISTNKTWSLLDPTRAGCYTAVLTLNHLLAPFDGNSFEFAPNFGQCVYHLNLPLVMRQ